MCKRVRSSLGGQSHTHRWIQRHGIYTQTIHTYMSFSIYTSSYMPMCTSIYIDIYAFIYMAVHPGLIPRSAARSLYQYHWRTHKYALRIHTTAFTRGPINQRLLFKKRIESNHGTQRTMTKMRACAWSCFLFLEPLSSPRRAGTVNAHLALESAL